MSFSDRFVGPRPEWVNGGVIAGTLAAELPGHAVTVRIERPVLVATELQLEIVDGMVELRDDDGQRLAVARAVETEFVDVPEAISFEVATSTISVVPRDGHPAAGCFVCGPEHPSGLDLQPGPVPDGSCLATTLAIRDELAPPSGGEIEPHVVWAAMDCPGWYAGCSGEMALLGSMTARQFVPISPGDQVVVQSWRRGTEGRKVFVGAALRSPTGALLAASHAIWIMTPDLAA